MRLFQHYNFVLNRLAKGKTIKYVNNRYQFPVVSKQEKKVQFNKLHSVNKINDQAYEVSYKKLSTDKYVIEEDDLENLKEKNLEHIVDTSQGKKQLSKWFNDK